MASNDVTLTIGANLTPAQRQLQGFIVQAQRQLGSQSFAFKLDERGFRQPLGRITGDLNQFQGAMDASIARTLAFGASVGAIAGVTKAFKDLVGVTIKVEHSLKEINVLLNLSTKDLKGFSKELFAVAKNTASSFDTVSVAATEFSRQGLSAAETAKRVNSALILTRLSGLDAEASVSALTAAVNGFKREAVTTTEVVNRLANVDAAFAVSSGDLAKALSRAGSVSQDAKVKFNELLAATTAVQQATARGGNVIGNGFKTIFTRLQRSKVRSELEKIGVATTNSMGGMRGAIDILKDYAKVYQTLSDTQKAYTSEQVAGVFQINTLKALVNDLSSDYGVYNKALAVANATTNEAVKRNEELNKTLQSLASQTGTEIAELASKIGAISFESNFKGILGFIKSALGDVNKTIDSEGIGGTLARGVLKGFGDFISGPGLAVALVGITRLLYFIGKQTKTAVAQVFQIGTAAQKRQVVQQRINALLMEDNNLLSQIRASSGNINDINAIVTKSILAQNTALQRQKLLVTEIAAGFQLTKSGSIAPIGGMSVASRPPSGRGPFGRGAQGFVPNMVRGERSSISRGVGGARAGDRPVVIPNFNFGGGKTGTMVAHTGEHIVPNFAQGGSAIFNRNMASSVGLPMGAVKVGAQGFVPNFAKKFAEKGASPGIDIGGLTPTDLGFLGAGKTITIDGVKYNAAHFGTTAAAIKKGTTAKQKRKAKQKKLAGLQTLKIPADIVGVASALGKSAKTGANTGKEASSLSEKARIGEAIIAKKTKGTAPGNRDARFTKFNLEGVQVKSLQSAKDDKFAIKEFKKKIAQFFSEPLLDLGDNLLGGIYEPKARKEIGDALKKQDPADLFSSAVEGGIFETAIRVITRGMELSKPYSEEKNPFFDFEPHKEVQDKFITAFGFNKPSGNLYKADAKRTATTDNIRTLVNKSLADKEVLDKFLQNEKVKEQIGKLQKANTAAQGFIPSFANLASIAASPAGKRAMATERALAGSSRMGYDSRVGYGVFNNSQGSLSNAVSQHMNAGDSAASLASTGAAAQGVSAAEGYVPNFVVPGAVAAKGIQAGIMKAFSWGTKLFTKKAPTAFKGMATDINKLFMASYGLSTAAGLVAEGLAKAEKGAAAARVSGTVGGMTSGLMLGGMSGNAGVAAVLALGGAIAGFVGASSGVEQAILGIAKERNEAMQKAAKEQQAVGAYVEKLERVMAAETPQGRVSAERDLSEALAGMEPEMAAQVRALGENTGELRNLIIEMKTEAKDADVDLELKGARESQKTVQELQRGGASGDWFLNRDPNNVQGHEARQDIARRRAMRKEIEEEGVGAKKTATGRGVVIAGQVDYTKVDPEKIREMTNLLESITALEFPEGADTTGWGTGVKGKDYNPFRGFDAGLKGKTVGEYLTKDLGMKTIPKELEGVLDKTFGDLQKGYSSELDTSAESRQTLEIMAGLSKATSDTREAWDKMAPKRAQEQADMQAAALEKRLQAMSLSGPGAVLGKVVRAEQRNVAMRVDTSKFQDQLGKFRKLLIGDDPDATQKEKIDRIAGVERKAIGRGEEVALDKQKVKFLGEIVKSIGESDIDSDQLTALNEIQMQLGLNQSAADILAQDNQKIQGDALEQLKDQVAATDAIKASATRQTKLLELNALRQAALLEETRRQKVKEAVQKGATTILSEGHDLRAAIDAIARYGGTVGKPLGGNLKGEEGTILAMESRLKSLQGFSSPEYQKEGEEKLLGRQEALFIQGQTKGLGGTLHDDILKSGVDTLDDYVQAAIAAITVGAQIEGGADFFEGTGINPEAQAAQLEILLDGLKNFSKTRGENEQRKALEKLLAATEKAAAEQRDRAALTGADRMGINSQMGTANLTNQAKVQEARIEQTQKTIDDVLNMVEVGSDTDIESMRYDLIAAIKQIPGLSDEYLEGMGEKGVPELLEDLQTWQTSQRDHASAIEGTLQEIIKNGENVKANTDALTTLTTVLAALKKTTVKELLGEETPTSARGFIPSMARGGVSDAMSRERRAIAGGVGGAIAGVDRARMITLNGGPAAVNTGESLVHNYRGTGQTAVFNRSMISRGGRPAGATPVFASGYFPGGPTVPDWGNLPGDKPSPGGYNYGIIGVKEHIARGCNWIKDEYQSYKDNMAATSAADDAWPGWKRDEDGKKIPWWKGGGKRDDYVPPGRDEALQQFLPPPPKPPLDETWMGGPRPDFKPLPPRDVRGGTKRYPEKPMFPWQKGYKKYMADEERKQQLDFQSGHGWGWDDGSLGPDDKPWKPRPGSPGHWECPPYVAPPRPSPPGGGPGRGPSRGPGGGYGGGGSYGGYGGGGSYGSYGGVGGGSGGYFASGYVPNKAHGTEQEYIDEVLRVTLQKNLDGRLELGVITKREHANLSKKFKKNPPQNVIELGKKEWAIAMKGVESGSGGYSHAGVPEVGIPPKSILMRSGSFGAAYREHEGDRRYAGSEGRLGTSMIHEMGHWISDERGMFDGDIKTRKNAVFAALAKLTDSEKKVFWSKHSQELKGGYGEYPEGAWLEEAVNTLIEFWVQRGSPKAKRPRGTSRGRIGGPRGSTGTPGTPGSPRGYAYSSGYVPNFANYYGNGGYGSGGGKPGGGKPGGGGGHYNIGGGRPRAPDGFFVRLKNGNLTPEDHAYLMHRDVYRRNTPDTPKPPLGIPYDPGPLPDDPEDWELGEHPYGKDLPDIPFVPNDPIQDLIDDFLNMIPEDKPKGLDPSQGYGEDYVPPPPTGKPPPVRPWGDIKPKPWVPPGGWPPAIQKELKEIEQYRKDNPIPGWVKGGGQGYGVGSAADMRAEQDIHRQHRDMKPVEGVMPGAPKPRKEPGGQGFTGGFDGKMLPGMQKHLDKIKGKNKKIKVPPHAIEAMEMGYGVNKPIPASVAETGPPRDWAAFGEKVSREDYVQKYRKWEKDQLEGKKKESLRESNVRDKAGRAQWRIWVERYNAQNSSGDSRASGYVPNFENGYTPGSGYVPGSGSTPGYGYGGGPSGQGGYNAPGKQELENGKVDTEICDLFPELCTGVFGATSSRPKPPSDINTKIATSMPAKVYERYIETNPLTFGFPKFLDNSFKRGYPWQQDGKGYLKNWAPWPLTAPPNQIEPYVGIAMEEYLKLRAKIELWKEKWIGDESQTGPRGGIGPLIEKSIPGYKPGKYKASGYIPNFAGGGAGSVNNSSAVAAANARAQKNRKKAEEELKKMRAAKLGTQFGNRKTQFGNRSSQFGNRSSQFGNRSSAFNNAEGYIPNLSLGSQMVPNMSASNHFLNLAEGSPAAPTSAPAPTSLVGGQTPGEALITQAKASQEKHNVNVNIEVYGNLSQDQVDKVQENGSNMATVLEELVNGGL